MLRTSTGCCVRHPDYLDVRLRLDQRPESRSDHLVIVDEDDPKCRIAGFRGDTPWAEPLHLAWSIARATTCSETAELSTPATTVIWDSFQGAVVTAKTKSPMSGFLRRYQPVQVQRFRNSYVLGLNRAVTRFPFPHLGLFY